MDVLLVPDGPQGRGSPAARPTPTSEAPAGSGRGCCWPRPARPGTSSQSGSRPRPDGWPGPSVPAPRPPRRTARGGPRPVPSVGPPRWPGRPGRGDGYGAGAAGVAAPPGPPAAPVRSGPRQPRRSCSPWSCSSRSCCGALCHGRVRACAKGGPAGGALSQAPVLAGAVGGDVDRPGSLPVVDVVGHNRSEVGLGEPGVDDGVAEGRVDRDRVTQFGQLDGGGHFDAHLRTARRGGLGEPEPSAGTQGEELRLSLAASPRPPGQCPGRGGREVLIDQAWAAWAGP